MRAGRPRSARRCSRLFGDQAVRELAAQARRDLVDRADELLRSDAARFAALIEGAAVEAEGLAQLHAAIDAVRRAS